MPLDVENITIKRVCYKIKDLGTITSSPLSIDLMDNQHQKLVIDVNLTLNAVQDTSGFRHDLYLEVTQEGTTGGHTLTLGTNFVTEGGAGITLSSGAGEKDLLIFVSDSDGNYRLVSHLKNYS